MPEYLPLGKIASLEALSKIWYVLIALVHIFVMEFVKWVFACYPMPSAMKVDEIYVAGIELGVICREGGAWKGVKRCL